MTTTKTSRRLAAAMIAILLLSACILTGCGKNDDGAPAGMKLASTEIVDYSFYVPEDWIVDLSTGAVSAYVSEHDMTNVSMMAWNLEDVYMELPAWWEEYQSDFNLVFDEFEILSEENTILGETAAMKYIYTASLAETQYKFMQVAAIRRGMVYLFTYTTVPDNFDTNLDSVNSILENFKFN